MVTPEDLKRDAINSVDIDFTDTATQPGIGTTYRAISLQGIADAIGYVEGFLDRTLEVDSYTDYIDPKDWEYNSAREQYTVYAENRPIQSVDTDGVEYTKSLLISGSRTKKVEYTAGYTTLPTDIRRTITNIAIYLILVAYDNLIPYQSTEKNISGVATTISKDPMYIERELKRIEGYQRLQ